MTTNNQGVGTRELALMILLEIERGEKSHIVLRQVLEKYQYLSKQDRAFLTRLAEGTTERRIELDYIINQFSKVKTEKMKPVIRNILRCAVYQIKYMDQVPDSAACNEAVNLAIRKGFKNLRGFVNGVLRNIARNIDKIAYPENTEEFLSIKYSMPQWIIRMWVRDYGEEKTKYILEGFYKERATTIRINGNATTKEELIRELTGEGIQVKEHPLLASALLISGYDYLAAIPAFREGKFQVQDAASIMVAEQAGIKEGDYILDVCAAPGGKATELGAKLQGEGVLAANDISNSRAKGLLKNIEVFGIGNVLVLSEEPGKMESYFTEYFDKILIDAPCSGEGMFRKDKKMVSAWEEHGPDFFCNIQKSIILQAARMLKQGGMMLYSTCTFDPKENEQVIEHLLKTYPEFRILKIAPYEGFVQGMPEVTESRDPSLADTVRIFPHKMKGEGHYLALVQKGEPCDRVKGELTGGKGKKKLPEELEEFLNDVKKEIRTDLLDIHGERVYVMPAGLPNLKGLRFLRTGLLLGELKKKRFEPSQAFAMTLKKDDYEKIVDLPLEDDRVSRYLKGETLDVDDLVETKAKGWYLVCVDGYPLGWGKLANGTLKNKYLPGWRLNS